MLVILVFPDDTSARVPYAEAIALMNARGPHHGLRVYDDAQVWDGAKDRDPYLTARVEPNRRDAERPSVLGSPSQRVRTIQSVSDLPPDQRAQIAIDGQRLGPTVAGRRWNLSKQSVVRVMKIEGVHTCPPTKREAKIFGRAPGRRFFSRAHA